MTEDEMAGWHHQLHGHEFEWALGVGDGQGGLACCSSWGCKELDMTERLHNNKALSCHDIPMLSHYPHMVFCSQIFRRPPGLYSVGSPCSLCSSPSLLSWAHGNSHTVTFPLLSCRVCALQEQRNSCRNTFL